MRIVLLSTNDEFAGEMQRVLYETHPEWIVGSVISSVVIYNHSWWGGLLFVLRKSGVWFLLKMVHLKVIRRFVDRRRRLLPSQLARICGVEEFLSSNINDEKSIARLQAWKPDVIISTNFNHYVGKTVRESIARYGCWNLHKSLLPRYRGMAPNFHALLNGATTVGVTLHLVAKSFDTGDVLAQSEIPVTRGDSVYSLNRKTSQAGGRLLASFLEGYDPISTEPVPQPEGTWKNYTYPSREEIRTFRKKGLHFYLPYPDETIPPLREWYTWKARINAGRIPRTH